MPALLSSITPEYIYPISSHNISAIVIKLETPPLIPLAIVLYISFLHTNFIIVPVPFSFPGHISSVHIFAVKLSIL